MQNAIRMVFRTDCGTILLYYGKGGGYPACGRDVYYDLDMRSICNHGVYGSDCDLHKMVSLCDPCAVKKLDISLDL